MMRQYEITYATLNSEYYTKQITALVIEPDVVNADTGLMLFSHGWSGNRFQHQDKMQFTADAFNLVCMSVEFRQSGYDYDPVRGLGSMAPYDVSFFQLFDVLNGLRCLLALKPALNRRRLFHYGGSQGGHLALLSAIYAPHTFAFVYAASPMTHLPEDMLAETGRSFAPYELAARDAALHAENICCPVYLEHGTSDTVVDCDAHTRALESKLRSLGKPVHADYYKGGGHGLEPIITRLETFKRVAPDAMRTLVTHEPDDFVRGSIIELACADRILRVDWSQPATSMNLFSWIPCSQ
ncbi:MAG: alpha/beta hydrolase family protein [Anaerolineae bacterium]